MEVYLAAHASKAGPFFEGRDPSFAEAALAPSLFRIAASLEGIRHIKLVPACEKMGLVRLVSWLTEVLERPEEVCDVAPLPAHVYVTMARKLHVRYEGPPSEAPASLGRRAASLDGGRRLTALALRVQA